MSLDCSQRTLILAMFMRRYAKVRHVLRDYELEGEVSANHMQLPDEGKSDKMHRYTLDTHLCIPTCRQGHVARGSPSTRRQRPVYPLRPSFRVIPTAPDALDLLLTTRRYDFDLPISAGTVETLLRSLRTSPEGVSTSLHFYQVDHATHMHHGEKL